MMTTFALNETSYHRGRVVKLLVETHITYKHSHPFVLCSEIENCAPDAASSTTKTWGRRRSFQFPKEGSLLSYPGHAKLID